MLRTLRRLGKGWRQLGPGLITGAADDDPSGIATYSQAGAQFGFGMLWTVVFTLPLMAAIQIVSARIGYVTGHGLAFNIRRAFPRPVLLAVMGLLVVANTLNIAADFAAMAQALALVAGGSTHVYAITFGLVSLVLQVFLRYATYVRWLKWLTLEGRGFYAVIAAAMVGGVVLCFTPTRAVQELFWSAVLNGIVAVPIMAVMMLLASRADLMAGHPIGVRLRWLGWSATAVMALAVGALAVSAL